MLLNKNQRSNPRKILFTGKPKTMARVDHNSWELRCVHLVQTPLEDHSVLLTPKSEELSMLQIKTQLLVEMLVMIDQFLSINKSVIKVANTIKLSKFSRLPNQTWRHKVLWWLKSSSQMHLISRELSTLPRIDSLKRISLVKPRITINLWLTTLQTTILIQGK